MNRRVKIYGGPADGREFVTDAPYFEVPTYQRSRFYNPYDAFDMERSLKTVRYVVYPYGQNEGVAFPSWVQIERMVSKIAIDSKHMRLADEWMIKEQVRKRDKEFWESQDRLNCFIISETVEFLNYESNFRFDTIYGVEAWAIKLFPLLPELVTLGKRDHLRNFISFGRKTITDEELCRTTVDADPDPEPSTEVVRVGATERRATENQGPVGFPPGGGEIRLGGRAFGKSDAAKIHRISES